MGMDKMKLDACGKINLMLNISGVREDGYHTLETVMQTVSLHDAVEVRRRVQKGMGAISHGRRQTALSNARDLTAALRSTSARPSRWAAAWPAAAPTRRPCCGA